MPVSHYENFPVASWVGPPALRDAISAIYSFARGADDIADEGADPPALRLSRLDHYAAMLDHVETARGVSSAAIEAPFGALAAAVRRHALPIEPFRELLSAFRQDVLKTRYADFAELLDYCRRSANPVGRLLLRLYRVSDETELRRADAICTGLQLTNFWQDVAVDWAKGRVYLPVEDLARFGVAEGQIAEGRADERWRRLMAFEVERSRELLQSGRALARALPLRARLELKLVVAGGLSILRAIDRAQGDVFRHRPVLRRRDWAAMWVAVLAP
ncbi:MAG: squalene synthase HpnC [Casimicrobiaceae bacterium]